MKRILIILLFLCCLPQLAEGEKAYVVRYDVHLTCVSRNGVIDSAHPITSEPFSDLEGTRGTRFHFADEVMNMTWYVSDIAFNYTLKNDFPLPIYIPTKDISFCDTRNRRDRMGYDLEGNKENPVFTINTGTFISGFFIPRKNYLKDKEEIDIRPILPNTFPSEEEASKEAQDWIGKAIKLSFPVIQGGIRHQYELLFEIKGVSAITASPESGQDGVNQTKSDIDKMANYSTHINYFNRVCPQEKVYLHFDNTAYFQGETIWYAANVVDATTGKKAASKVLYVELLSPTGVVLKQHKLKVVNGRCHGSFPLVDGDVKEAVDLRGAIGYPSGYYQIRAYTRAQLNFDEASIFSRVIPVYKEPEQEGFYDDPVIAEYEGTERNRPKLPRSERPKSLNVSFFPEGGHLIEGVSCRMAFKVTDEHGMGMNVDSLLTDDEKRIPTSPMHKGMGFFATRPDKTPRNIVFMKDGKRHTFSLPRAEQKGYSLRLDVLRGDTIRIAIEGRNMQKEDSLGYTVIRGGEAVAYGDVKLNPDVFDKSRSQALLRLPKEGLPTGVHQFTLFNEDGAVFAQRLFFIDNGIPTVPVAIEQSRTDLQPFDSLSLHFQTQVPATFSVSVRDAADYGTAYRDDIRTYMLLSSELKGLIEDPGWYFVDSHQEALDLLMMVQGWTRYNWQQMAGVESFKPRHYTEERLVLDGWAFSRLLETPLSDVKMTAKLYSPDRKLVQNSSVITDSLGYWSIGLEDFEGKWDLFLFSKQKTKLKENATTRIRLERSSRPEVKPFLPEDIFLPDFKNEYPALFSWQEKKPKLEFLPEIGDSYLIDEVVIEGKRRYIDYNRFRAFDADMDTEMDLDEGNYTKDLPGYLESKGYSLEFEYLDSPIDYNQPGIKVPSYIKDIRVNGRRTSFNSSYSGKSPRRFPQDEERKWWEIQMEEVESVLVFDYEPGHRYVEIRAVLKGIDKLKKSDKNSRHTTFSGYTPVVEFYAPTYPNGPIPGDKDYRRTIYWNPEVTTDSTGRATVSFYNNGYSRALTISAEGLTPDGVPIINR